MPKESDGKAKLNLIYYSLMEEVAKARVHGVEKYPGRDSWRDVPIADYYDAAIRHLIKAKAAALDEFSEFAPTDSESGVSHLGHAAANIMFLIEADRREKQCP